MTSHFARRALTRGSATALLLCTSFPTLLAQETIEGAFALPGVPQAVNGQLKVVETGPLSREIELVFTDKATGEQIEDFDLELTKELHILATDAGLTHLIHQHPDGVAADGTFTATLEFPEPGRYHIYTDAVPTGLGQQVLRFDVTVGDETETTQSQPATTDSATGELVSSDGPYTVTLDASQLKAGVESAVSLLVEKDGAPAADLEPYLGVSAHAVFIRAEDLAYVHAHATPGDDALGHEAHEAPAPHHATEPDAGGHEHGAMAAGHENGHDAAPAPQEAHDSHAAAAAGSVEPEMSLHVTPPAPGTYALWIEFIGGEEIRTVPFTIEIPEN